MKNKKLYLFDFDGTITNNDSFIHFLTSMLGAQKVFFKVVYHFPRILYTLLTNKRKSKVKELLLGLFFKGKTEQELIDLGKKYSDRYLDQIVRPKAIAYIKAIDRDDSDVFLISASVDIWLRNFANSNEMQLIATKLSYESNCFTGKFEGENCKGIEKVNRLRKIVNLNDYQEIISFGDSNGDKEMLEISSSKNYKPFRN